jgi:predicted HD phosphohydrolase
LGECRFSPESGRRSRGLRRPADPGESARLGQDLIDPGAIGGVGARVRPGQPPAGADEEVVVAALCHDIGKAVSVPNHPRIAAEILRPYVSDEVYKMILVHQDFQGRHYYGHFGGDPDAREKHRDELTDDEFALAARFADEWDQIAFDPDGPTEPLEHFEPAVRRVFGQAKLF